MDIVVAVGLADVAAPSQARLGLFSYIVMTVTYRRCRQKTSHVVVFRH